MLGITKSGSISSAKNNAWDRITLLLANPWKTSFGSWRNPARVNSPPIHLYTSGDWSNQIRCSEGNMPHDDPSKSAVQSKLVIRNIGLLLSGDLSNPILDADTVVSIDNRIVAVGKEKDVDTSRATINIDAKGTVLAPGLIDSHVHPVCGDWTPRQNQLGWIDSYLHGGVTTMVSAGEVHTPGRPKDVVGLKAMAIFAQRSFHSFRPGGVKVYAGAPVIEHGMVEDDFKELAAAGVRILGEVGLGSVKDGKTAHQMVSWARKYGIQSTIHTGGPSIPGSSIIDKDMVLETDADVIGHVNGGHTALPDDQITALCERSTRALEIVHNGNERAGLLALRTAKELGQLERVILGTDSPAGSGVQPLGIVRLIAMLSALGEIPAELAICLATGNTAKIRNLDDGVVAPGRGASFVLMDKAQHSAGKNLIDSIQKGDLPGIGMVIVDGAISVERSRNTPPATRIAEVVKS
jgi:enamidase